MSIYLQYNPDDIKYNNHNDMIDYHDNNAPYFKKVQQLLLFDKTEERESKPKYLSVKSHKPVFYVQFENNNVVNNKRLNLRFSGRDTLTIQDNVLKTFDTRNIGPAFLNELGGPCKSGEEFIWNKSKCEKK